MLQSYFVSFCACYYFVLFRLGCDLFDLLVSWVLVIFLWGGFGCVAIDVFDLLRLYLGLYLLLGWIRRFWVFGFVIAWLGVVVW